MHLFLYVLTAALSVPVILLSFSGSGELIPELVLGSTSMIFNVFLLSSVFDEETVIPVETSVPYASVLFVKMFAYAALELWIPVGVTLIGALEWMFIAVYRNDLDY